MPVDENLMLEIAWKFGVKLRKTKSGGFRQSDVQLLMAKMQREAAHLKKLNAELDMVFTALESEGIK